MISEWLSEAEMELLRWYRSLNKFEVAAVNLWLNTGDHSLMLQAFTHRHLEAA
jgi:hypothetical protein